MTVGLGMFVSNGCTKEDPSFTVVNMESDKNAVSDDYQSIGQNSPIH